MFKRFVMLFTVLVVVVSQFVFLGSGFVNESKALGQPNIIKISPASPQPVGTCITVRAKVDWDDEFRSMRMRFGNEGWQEEATAEFERTFCTDGYAPGWYKIRVEVARKGDNSWSNPTVTEASYQITSTEPSQSEIDCVVNTVSVSPSSPQTVDTKVGIDAIGWCSTGVRAMRVKIDGGIIYELGSPSINAEWRTDNHGAGWHKITVEVAGRGDNDWSQAARKSVQFQVVNKSEPTQSSTDSSQSTENPISYFSTGDVIQIGHDVYVIVNKQRRLVPNPDTLDALGISRSWIDNQGLTDNQLKQISRGWDIPDVNQSPTDLQHFKEQYFPNTDSISSESKTQEESQNVDLSMTVSSKRVVAGEGVTVSWKGFSPSGNDWVSLYPVGDQEAYVAWEYIHTSTGSKRFFAPEKPGRYRFGLFRNGPRVTVSSSFEVEVLIDQPEIVNGFSKKKEESEKQSKMCEVGVKVGLNPRFGLRHWFVLEIPKQVSEPFEIHFKDELVPDDDTGVRHDGYIGETEGYIRLGISTSKFVFRKFPDVFDSSNWKVRYSCEND